MFSLCYSYNEYVQCYQYPRYPIGVRIRHVYCDPKTISRIYVKLVYVEAACSIACGPPSIQITQIKIVNTAECQ